MKTYAALLLMSACAVSAATEEKIDKTFAVKSGGSLVVEVDFGSIEVTTSPNRSEVSVDIWRKVTRWSQAEEESFLKDNPVEFVRDGDTVTVRARARNHFTWSWFTGWRNRNEARTIVQVPEHFNARLETAGGSIAVSDVSGSVEADTRGGPLQFSRVHGPLAGHTSGGGIKVFACDGEIRIETSGGGIEVNGGGGSLHGDTSGGGITVKTFSGPIAVETSGGGITIENIQGKIAGSTSGGPIRAVLPSPVPGDVDLETSGGGVTLSVAADAAFKLDAETSGGGVNCELPLTVQGNIQRNQITGTVNAGGPSVKLRSSGGGILIKKL
jgi:DUF4097 and DUF4098 domain-containing protein YvlB